MDREQEEMRFLGFFGVFRESFKIIYSWRKIFTQISLTLILPLSFVFLLQIEVSHVLLSEIIRDKAALHWSTEGSPRYKRLSDLLSKELIAFLLFKAAYLTFMLVLSLLSTSAVVYTVACIYTGREVAFKEVLSVVPRVWKRLVVTFLCIFAAMFVYHTFAFGLLIEFYLVSDLVSLPAVLFVSALLVLGVLCLVGFVYMSVVWHLASVISVLEEDYGFRAMAKGKDLIKGKLMISVIVFLVLIVFQWLVLTLFRTLVVYGSLVGVPAKVGLGVLCFVLLSGCFLIGLTIQTVIYFVCKSYHHENIDKTALSVHLDAFLGEYMLLKAKDVQLEQYDV